MTRVVIAGAGIGGLAAALSLRAVGLDDLVVLERAPALDEVGAGITVQTNALSAIGTLRPDLVDGITAAGQVVATGEVVDWRGRALSRLDMAQAARAVGGPPPVAIHRATLQRLLLDACRPLAPRLGAEVVGFDALEAPERGGVAARLADGAEERGDVLVGADGLRSAVRAQLLGREAPRYAGYTCWRGVTEDACGWAPGRVAEVWGPGARFGVVPIGGGRIYWFATHSEPAGGRDDDVHARLADLFGRWMPPIPALIAATPAARVIRNDISDRPPIDRWGAGPVTLLGDAAHPMTPNLGQGACQAIEDAVVLARALAGADDLVAALRRYEALRAPRVRAIVLRAWRLGHVGQWRSGVARWARDLGVRLTPERQGQRMVEDVFRFTPPPG